MDEHRGQGPINRSLELARHTAAALALLVVSACVSTAPSSPSDLNTSALTGTSWRATLIGKELATGRRPLLHFGYDKRVTGNAGCTVYFGSAEISAGAIRFENVRPGNESDIYAKSCEPPDLEQQSRFLSALRSARQIRVVANQALLLDARHQVLVHLERREEPRVSGGLVVSEISRVEPGQYAASTEYAPASASEHAAAELRRGFRNDPLADLEFMALTPALGEYFGTDQGVLVTRASALNAFELREGDVILSINDRQPANAPHTLRILSGYAPGSTLDLKIMRQHEPLNLKITLTE
jgi:heat shock protein HslJ